MHYKIRKGVFETNSSTQHTLTIQRQVDSSATTGRIPSDSVFKFVNYRDRQTGTLCCFLP